MNITHFSERMTGKGASFAFTMSGLIDCEAFEAMLSQVGVQAYSGLVWRKDSKGNAERRYFSAIEPGCGYLHRGLKLMPEPLAEVEGEAPVTLDDCEIEVGWSSFVLVPSEEDPDCVSVTMKGTVADVMPDQIVALQGYLEATAELGCEFFSIQQELNFDAEADGPQTEHEQEKGYPEGEELAAKNAGKKAKKNGRKHPKKDAKPDLKEVPPADDDGADVFDSPAMN